MRGTSADSPHSSRWRSCWSRRPTSSSWRARCWAGLTVAFLILARVYAIVHGVVVVRAACEPRSALARRPTSRSSTGARAQRVSRHDQPQEDASWIFQLRMAELERAKSGRTSEPRPWHRLAARLFDYAIWGLVLALLLSELRALGIVPEDAHSGSAIRWSRRC